MSRRLAFALALLAAVAPMRARAQSKFTIDQLARIVGVSSPDVSPDGKTVVFVVSKPNYTNDKNESDIYAVDVAGGAPRALTARHFAGDPHWSPDGKTIAFLAPDSAMHGQIWLLPVGGGEARQLTASPTGVNQYAWRPDGGAIAFAADDEAPKRTGESKFLTTFTVGAQDMFLTKPLTPQHIWLVPSAGGEAKRLTSGAWTLEFVLPPGSPPSGLSWSPDGARIAFAYVPAPESGKLDSVSIRVLEVATGKITPLTGVRRFENNPVFSPDGKSIAYWQTRDGNGEAGWVNEVYVVPSTGGTGRSITRAIDRNLYGAEWTSDGKALVVAGNDRTSVGAWVQPVDGSAPKRLELGDLVVNGAFGYELTVAKTGAIVFVATSPDRPSEMYVMATPTSAPKRLTEFNAWATEVGWGTMERVTWKGPNGFDEDGTLTLPPGFSPSNKYPLVLLIHGGPTSASKLSFSSLAQLMAAEGWVVFSPNYRGSDNLGNAYQAAIVGDAGSGPGKDVMAGVAMLRQRPYVDKTKTAVTGWSYGGYMTSWLIGNYPGEWKAAMAGAPVTNWEDMYNLGDGNIAIRYLFGGSPWTGGREKAYREQSPITYARNITVPTLVMSNMEDFRVPPSQAFALYRAMKDNGVEAQFVGFVGRAHASGDPVNSKERTRLWVEWVRDHIGGAPAVHP
jgi:dipeptidyl aminopeptidase/acylaminoacyl peptidase